MRQIVFYSWQSDLPNNCNRGLIQSALESAIEEIAGDERCALEPVIDRDTLGTPGSPDISGTILAKIDASSLFVADVSLIDSHAAKPTPNPNVLLELGYAVKVLGWDRVVMVMNTEFGGPERLPFDLRSRRTTTYSVSSEAPEKAPARNGLSKTLTAAIRLALDGHDRPARVAVQTATRALGQGDKVLFEQFLDALPSSGSIRFIDQHNMAGFSFPSQALNQLQNFHDTWNDAEHEFVDDELERLRSKLYGLVGIYLGVITESVSQAHTPGHMTVPPDWETRNPKMFFEVVSRLHESAAQVVAAHQELVRVGRHRMDAL